MLPPLRLSKNRKNSNVPSEHSSGSSNAISQQDWTNSKYILTMTRAISSPQKYSQAPTQSTRLSLLSNISSLVKHNTTHVLIAKSVQFFPHLIFLQKLRTKSWMAISIWKTEYRSPCKPYTISLPTYNVLTLLMDQKSTSRSPPTISYRASKRSKNGSHLLPQDDTWDTTKRP